MPRSIACLPFLLLTLLSCQSTSDVELVSEELRSMLARMEEATARGDAEAVAAFYTEDAVRQHLGGDVITGRDAIRDELAEGFEQFRIELRSELSGVDLISDGEVAIGQGRNEGKLHMEGGSQAMAFVSEAMIVFVRDGSGWLISHVAWAPGGMGDG